MSTAVIGATGRVGSEVVRGLLARGDAVAALVRDPGKARRTFGEPGGLQIRATRLGKDTSYGKIIEAIERAERSKAPIQRLSDQLAGYIVIVAFAFAALEYYLTKSLIDAATVIIVAGACGVGGTCGVGGAWATIPTAEIARAAQTAAMNFMIAPPLNVLQDPSHRLTPIRHRVFGV